MPKKIFDIIPPKEIKKTNRACFNLRKYTDKKEQFFDIDFNRGFKFLRNKKIFVCSIISLIIFCFFCSFCFSSAEVEVWPDTKTLEFEKDIIIDGNISYSDFSRNIIAGKIISVEKEISQKFKSNGFVNKKAEGVIRVYNNYSTYSQPLVANTRFVSASGKLFRSPNKVIVPGRSYKKGKLSPGYVDITVIADQAGKEYNIEPTTFSIPGFAGTDKYTRFYAESFSKMSGGGQFPKITQQDLDNAKTVSSDRLKKEQKMAIQAKAEQENFILLDQAIKNEVIDDSLSIKQETELEEFDFKIKGNLSALVFSEQDLKNFAQYFIKSKISENKRIHKPSLEINYSLTNLDFEQGKMNLSLTCSSKIYSVFDIISFKKAITGKSFEQAKIILENEQDIKKFALRLWPFWVKKIPQNLEKIDVKLNIE